MADEFRPTRVTPAQLGDELLRARCPSCGAILAQVGFVSEDAAHAWYVYAIDEVSNVVLLSSETTLDDAPSVYHCRRCDAVLDGALHELLALAERRVR